MLSFSHFCTDGTKEGEDNDDKIDEEEEEKEEDEDVEEVIAFVEAIRIGTLCSVRR
jgi:hypothetical protein